MNWKLLLGLIIMLFGCEKAHNDQIKVTGTWHFSLEMFDDNVLIGEMYGEIVFYADQTARVLLEGESLEEAIHYQWYLQPDHIVLINQATKFPLPYYINSQSNTFIEMSQTDDVKMKLFR